MVVTNATRGSEIATRVMVADAFFSRLRGLLGRRIGNGDGLLIVPCRAVHTFGMRYHLDVAFVDQDNQVVGIRAAMAPNRMSSVYRAAHAALELPAGTLARSGTVPGDRLHFTDIAVPRSSLRRGARVVASEARATLSEHKILLIIVGAYLLAGMAASTFLPVAAPRVRDFFSVLLFQGALSFLLFALAGYAIKIKLTGRNGGVILCKKTWQDFQRAHLNPMRLRQIFGFLLILTLMPPFKRMFVNFKSAIPFVQPFSWDVRLAEVDRVLHFGRQPWQWLEPVFGNVTATSLLDRAYYLWFPIGICVLLWQAWSSDRRTRGQFFVSYALLWMLLGTVLAIAFSSAGPVYFGKVTGLPDPFQPLIQFLNDVNAERRLTAVFVHGVLWNDYAQAGTNPLEGISAMPSLHVAIATLYVLVARRVNHWLAVAFAAYALLIMLGSIQLGWHYAVDGYVAAALTVIVWKLSGLVLERSGRSPLL